MTLPSFPEGDHGRCRAADAGLVQCPPGLDELGSADGILDGTELGMKDAKALGKELGISDGDADGCGEIVGLCDRNGPNPNWFPPITADPDPPTDPEPGCLTGCLCHQAGCGTL